jgi:hypothetical protein
MRVGCGVAYDPRRNKLCLYGGNDFIQEWTETWEWDGRWRRIPTSLDPGPWVGDAFVYDPHRRGGICVLANGYYSGSAVTLWDWDGTQWQFVYTQTIVPPRHGAQVAYDRARRQIVLFGGFDAANNRTTSDTWTFDGIDWTLRQPRLVPDSRMAGGLTFDPIRGTCILWGGFHFAGQLRQFINDTWEWDGTDWRRLSPLSTPVHDRDSFITLGYNRASERVVLVGRERDETFELVRPCEYLGRGHSSGSLPLTCGSEPVLGGRLGLSFPSAFGVAVMFLAPGPSLDPPFQWAGAPFCAPTLLYPDLGRGFAVGVTGSPARFDLPIPQDQMLLGLTFAAQGAALQTIPCLRLTDGMRAMVSMPY